MTASYTMRYDVYYIANILTQNLQQQQDKKLQLIEIDRELYMVVVIVIRKKRQKLLAGI